MSAKITDMSKNEVDAYLGRFISSARRAVRVDCRTLSVSHPPGIRGYFGVELKPVTGGRDGTNVM